MTQVVTCHIHGEGHPHARHILHGMACTAAVRIPTGHFLLDLLFSKRGEKIHGVYDCDQRVPTYSCTSVHQRKI